MRGIIAIAVSIGASVIAAAGGGQADAARAGKGASVVLANARVRVFKTAGSSTAGVDHKAGVVIPIERSTVRKAGEASWAADAASDLPSGIGPVVIVEPTPGAAAPPAAAPGSRPGEGTFTKMTFDELFQNDAVTVIRARMEVGAREAFHTHASDTIVVHLSGGSIEDTADGVTKVNRWKPGDVEFEARGSSHSARNVGSAVDVVLVALKP